MKVVIVVIRLNILVVQLGLEGRLPPLGKRYLDLQLIHFSHKKYQNNFLCIYLLSMFSFVTL